MSAELDELMARLDVRSAIYKATWVDAAMARIVELAPRLRAYLEAVLADPEAYDRTRGAALGHLYALALLTAARDADAHDLVVRLARLPPDVLDPLLGRFVTQGLAGALAATSGGRTDGIEALLDDEAADALARGAALDALAFLAFRGEADRATVVELLARCLEGGSPFVVAKAVAALVDLQAVERRDDIRAAYEAERVDETVIGPDDVEALLGEGPDAAGLRLEYAMSKQWPSDPHGILASMYDLPPLPPPHRDRDEAPARPARPMRATVRDPEKVKAKRKAAKAARKRQRGR